VAKDQRLSLNPSQISGSCGRLMCCLRYEHEFYVESRRKYHKEGKIVRTSRGEEKIVANDIFRERVTLRGVDGEVRVLPLAALREELTTTEDPLAAALEAALREQPRVLAEPHADPALDLVDIELRMTGEHPIAHTMPPIPPRVQPVVPAAQAAPEGERRPPRRRGRRGGRRNRPGGGEGAPPARGSGDAGGGSSTENP